MESSWRLIRLVIWMYLASPIKREGLIHHQRRRLWGLGTVRCTCAVSNCLNFNLAEI